MKAALSPFVKAGIYNKQWVTKNPYDRFGVDMLRGKAKVERENPKAEIPEAFIIDELIKEQRVQPEAGYYLPCRQDFDEHDKTSSSSESSTVIIIEL